MGTVAFTTLDTTPFKIGFITKIQKIHLKLGLKYVNILYPVINVMTFNRGKFVYFFLKKVCNRLLTIIGLTRKGSISSSPPVTATPEHPAPAEALQTGRLGGWWPLTGDGAGGPGLPKLTRTWACE